MRVLLGHEDELEEEVRDVLDVEIDDVVRPFWNWSSISLEDNINNTDSVQDDNNCYSFRTIKYDHDHASSSLMYNISFSYDFTVLMSVGCTVGVLVAAYIMFRAYKLLFLTYCVSISRNSDQERSVEDSVCRIPRVRGCARSGSKGSTPPPPYDSPPPYHVAIVMYNNPDTPSNPVEISDPVYI